MPPFLDAAHYTVLESSRQCGPQAIESDTVQTPISLLIYMFIADVADSECFHARKCIAATVADRTSSMPEVPESHGPATYRPRHQRIREPRVRVWQVLHDESCSGGD